MQTCNGTSSWIGEQYAHNKKINEILKSKVAEVYKEQASNKQIASQKKCNTSQR